MPLPPGECPYTRLAGRDLEGCVGGWLYTMCDDPYCDGFCTFEGRCPWPGHGEPSSWPRGS